MEEAVIFPLLTSCPPLLPRQREADHEQEDVGEQAARARRHRLDGALHVARNLLPLVQGEGLARREGKEHVEVLE